MSEPAKIVGKIDLNKVERKREKREADKQKLKQSLGDLLKKAMEQVKK